MAEQLEDDENINDKPDGLTERQWLFVKCYCIHSNATKAAIEAGYSQETAAVIGSQNLRKLKIKEEIRKRFDVLALSAEGAVKIISDAAKSRLNDYLIIKQVVQTHTIKKAHAQLIKELEDKIEFENEFEKMAAYDDEEYKAFHRQQKERMREVKRLKLELSKNKDAFMFVQSDPELVERIEFDLVALARDKELGRIKKLKFNEFGPEIELPDSISAADKILQLHGKYKNIAKVENQITVKVVRKRTPRPGEGEEDGD